MQSYLQQIQIWLLTICLLAAACFVLAAIVWH